MEERLEQELKLLRKYYPDLEIDDSSHWILLPNYILPAGVGWNKEVMDICIEVKPSFPGTPPYGIYVPTDLRFEEQLPLNAQNPVNNQPIFPGPWAMLSWTPQEAWKPGSDVTKGSNLLNFVLSFADRFKEGR